MEQYATWRVEFMAAIQGSPVALEGKIEMMALEVNLLCVNLRRVTDKVQGDIEDIESLEQRLATLQRDEAGFAATTGEVVRIQP
ncbi:hypothetical protein NDU88_002247 [Pleurodeles waltl]|uniref:Uncharacterized protein n=1 Tax=Pleurodeles waltl TaxID=8319 RepID=A0AAV7VBY4_PLEWA|nr:hypothetical protein NDU88_002247 [Pleurodeles waltl]